VQRSNEAQTDYIHPVIDLTGLGRPAGDGDPVTSSAQRLRDLEVAMLNAAN
jgi:hypothetical protein